MATWGAVMGWSQEPHKEGTRHTANLDVMNASESNTRCTSFTASASLPAKGLRSGRPDLRRIVAAVIAAGSVAVVGVGAMPATEAQAAGLAHGVRHLHSISA